MNKFIEAMATGYLTVYDFLYSGMSLFRPHQVEHSIRILMFHDVRSKDYEYFYDLLRKLSKRGTIVNPRTFFNIDPDRIDNEKSKRQFLITFDDGFMSDYEAYRSIMEPLGLRGIFFACGAPIDGRLENFSGKEFISHNMGYGEAVSPEGLMGPDQLRELHADGNVIGFHTHDHVDVASLMDEQILQICSDADYFEQTLGFKIDHFAFPFGRVDNISNSAIRIISRRFSYVYSGIRGNNVPARAGQLLYRDNIDLSRSSFFNLGLLSGGFDFFYRSRRRKFLASKSGY